MVVGHLQQQHVAANRRRRLAQRTTKATDAQQFSAGHAKNLINQRRHHAMQHGIDVVAQPNAIKRRGRIAQSVMSRDGGEHGVEVIVIDHQHARVAAPLVPCIKRLLHLQPQGRLARAALAEHHRGRRMAGLAQDLGEVGVLPAAGGARQHRVLHRVLGDERIHHQTVMLQEFLGVHRCMLLSAPRACPACR